MYSKEIIIEAWLLQKLVDLCDHYKITHGVHVSSFFNLLHHDLEKMFLQMARDRDQAKIPYEKFLHQQTYLYNIRHRDMEVILKRLCADEIEKLTYKIQKSYNDIDIDIAQFEMYGLAELRRMLDS